MKYSNKLIAICSFATVMLFSSVNLCLANPPAQMRQTAAQGILKLDDGNFDEVLAQHPVVVVDFYADWCGPCRRFTPVFEQVAAEMKGSAAFAKLNVDNGPTVAKRYSISSIPAVAIFKDGKAVKHHRGGMSAEELKKLVREVI